MKFKSFLTVFLAGTAMCMFAQNSGVEYYKAGQLTNAKELLTRNLNSGDDRATSDYYLGMIAMVENNANEARKLFENGIASDAENPYNYIGIGRVELKNGNIKAAETEFKTAEKLGKKDASVYVAIARAYYDTDAVSYDKQIQKNIDKARRLDMNNIDLYLFEGDRKYDVDDIGGAANMYEMAATYNPSATEAYVKYANLFTKINPDYAINMLLNLLRENPESALGQHEISEAYYNKSDFANAAKYYGNYVKNPNHFKQDEDRYSFLLFYGQDYKKGYDYAGELLAANPANFTAQRYQFMNAAQLPELADQLLPLAEKLYANHKADKENNKFASIDYILLSNEFQKAQKYDDAIDVLNEGITVLPEQKANFYKQLSNIYVDMNQITNASTAFNNYIASIQNPGYNDYIQQALFLFYSSVENKQNPELSSKYLDDTLAAANKAAEVNPNGYRSYKMMGDVANQKASATQAKTAAVNDYSKAFELLKASDDPSRYASDARTIGLYLAANYIQNGQKEAARTILNDLLQISPDCQEAQTLLKGL